MGGRVWTDDEIEWIRENYAKEHVPHLLDQFEKRFGRRPTPAPSRKRPTSSVSGIRARKRQTP